MKSFKNSLALMLMLSTIFFTSCTSNSSRTTTTPEVNITTSVSPADGLDLKLVGQILQQGNVSDAASLEKELNKEGGINNLDLNKDGNVDFINVSENQGLSTVKSFDLTTGNGDNLTHLATVEVEKGANDTYNISLSGSETIYGQGAHYNTTSVGQMMFYSWLFSPRPRYYHSPYYYGHYPTYYRPIAPVSYGAYTTRTTIQRTAATKTITKSTTAPKSKVASSNKGKTSASTRTSINNHNKSARSMQARDKNKTTKTGGFTKSKSTTTPSTTKSKSSTSTSRSRSSSRSGGGRRSDVNYKTDVNDINDGLDMVLALESVSYYWDSESFDDNFDEVVGGDFDTRKQTGFIAQQVQQVDSNLVATDSFGLTVDYVSVIPYLVTAVQEQQNQIEQLTKLCTKQNRLVDSLNNCVIVKQ